MSPLDFRVQRKPVGLATKGRKYSIFEGGCIRYKRSHMCKGNRWYCWKI